MSKYHVEFEEITENGNWKSIKVINAKNRLNAIYKFNQWARECGIDFENAKTIEVL